MKLILFIITLLLTSLSLQAQEPKLVKPTGHGIESLNYIADNIFFNPEKTFVFTFGRRDAKLLIWDAKTSKKIKEFSCEAYAPFFNNKYVALFQVNSKTKSFNVKILNTSDLTFKNEFTISKNERKKIEFSVKNLFPYILRKNKEKLIVYDFIKNKSIELNSNYSFSVDSIYSSAMNQLQGTSTNLLGSNAISLYNENQLIFNTGKKVFLINLLDKTLQEIVDINDLSSDYKYISQLKIEANKGKIFINTYAEKAIRDTIYKPKDYSIKKNEDIFNDAIPDDFFIKNCWFIIDLYSKKVLSHSFKNHLNAIDFKKQQKYTVENFYPPVDYIGSIGQKMYFSCTYTDSLYCWEISENKVYGINTKILSSKELKVLSESISGEFTYDSGIRYEINNNQLFICFGNATSSGIYYILDTNDVPKRLEGIFNSANGFDDLFLLKNTKIKDSKLEYSFVDTTEWNLSKPINPDKPYIQYLTKNGFRYNQSKLLINLIEKSDDFRLLNDSMILVSGMFSDFSFMNSLNYLSDSKMYYSNLLINLNTSKIDKYHFAGKAINFSNVISVFEYGISQSKKYLMNCLTSCGAIDLKNGSEIKIKTKAALLKNTFNEISHINIFFEKDSICFVFPGNSFIKMENIFNDVDFNDVDIDEPYVTKSNRFIVIRNKIFDVKKQKFIDLFSVEGGELDTWNYNKTFADLFCENSQFKLSNKFSFLFEDTIKKRLFYLKKREENNLLYLDLYDLNKNITIASINDLPFSIKDEVSYTIDLKKDILYLYSNINSESAYLLAYDLQKKTIMWRNQTNTFHLMKSGNDGFLYLKSNLTEYDQNLMQYVSIDFFIKLDGKSGEIDFTNSFSELNNFVDFIIDHKHGNILLYQNLGNIVYLDINSGKVLEKSIKGIARNRNSYYLNRTFLLANDYLITDGKNESKQVRNAENGDLLFYFTDVVDLNGGNLIGRIFFDKHGRFDCEENLTDYLYLTCGTEIIDLSQVKDSLWVPGLVEKIMTDQEILIDDKPAPKLSDLNVCGLTPVIEPLEKGKQGEYRYRVVPRRGGLGETEVYINGNLTYSYLPKDLEKNQDGTYLLRLPIDSIQPYLSGGSTSSINPMLVKAKIKGASIYGRGEPIDVPVEMSTEMPRFFGVFVGVNDYGNPNKESSYTRFNDLDYASKDASDLSLAIEASARALFKDSTFIYRLSNDSLQDYNPSKENLTRVFEDIGKKAKANDVLFVFFAGHGSIDEKGDKKEIKFMLEKADKRNKASTGFGVADLSNWCHPKKVKAQKRVFVFDACHSGQFVNEQMAMAQGGRGGDEESARIRQLDKLKDKNGMMILAAAADDQSAYEDVTLDQGVLTYHLLNAMKSEKRDTTLTVNKWFAQTISRVEEYASRNGHNQSPNSFGSGRFEIGNITKDVREQIDIVPPKIRIGNCVFLDPTGEAEAKYPTLIQSINEALSQMNGRGERLVYSSSSDKTYTVQGGYYFRKKKLYMRYKIYYDNKEVASIEPIVLDPFKNKSEKEITLAVLESFKNALSKLSNI